MAGNFKKLMLIMLLALLPTGALCIIVDPLYQYHKPWFGMPVILDNAVYQTPGAARNLEYTDVIVGTSMTENFHTQWFDEEMGWDTIKLSYSGARSDDLKAIFSVIFSREEPVGHVFMDINDYQLTSPSWTAYVERPEYLYDSNLFNDYRYIFNRDIVVRSWERILDGLQGVEDNVDTAYTWEDEALFGREITLSVAREAREGLLQGGGSEAPLEQKLALCQENLENILPFIRQNPDTEFIVFLPPYSMLYWEQMLLRDNLEDMLEIYRYAIEHFLEYENVSLYYFQKEEWIVTDLEHYRDVCHHRPEFNRYIFDCVKQGKNRVTKENLNKTLHEMYDFAENYDYESYWQER
ncbi:MAG: hypothetical protein HFH93_00380 [Lachnospiraceae bacterium]|nr:hypothetical protein [Lachnospiraceae bacterium]